MIKTGFKLFIILFFILTFVYFYKKTPPENPWRDYTPVLFDSNADLLEGVEILRNDGYQEIVYREGITLGISNFRDLEEMTLNSISEKIDNIDFRNDPYINSVDKIFKNDKYFTLYIKIPQNDIWQIVKVYNSLSKKGLSFKLGNSDVLRVLLNYFSFILVMLLFSIGSKTRFFATLLSGIAIYFLMNVNSVYSFIGFYLIYFLIIMIIESLSFSNTYIKRNNIGYFRILFAITLFVLPTFFPTFLDYTTKIYTPVFSGDKEISYTSLEKNYDESLGNLSNYFAHYAYQKVFLYEAKYLFPSYKNSVTIEEFELNDYYLENKRREVASYDENFLRDFLLYCNSTAIGRFYLDFDEPFKLELNSLLTIYIVEKEYMQIGILAVIMFITSISFKKRFKRKNN